MTFVMLMTIVGFILSFFTTDQHFYSPHGILGLIVFLSMFLQPILSIFAILIPHTIDIKNPAKSWTTIYRCSYAKPLFVVVRKKKRKKKFKINFY